MSEICWLRQDEPGDEHSGECRSWLIGNNENVLGTLSPLTERGARLTLTQALAHALYYVVQCEWYIMALYHRQTKAALCVRETGRTARLGLSSMHCCVCPLTGRCPLTGNCPLTSMQAFLRAQMTAWSLLLRVLCCSWLTAARTTRP